MFTWWLWFVLVGCVFVVAVCLLPAVGLIVLLCCLVCVVYCCVGRLYCVGDWLCSCSLLGL